MTNIDEETRARIRREVAEIRERAMTGAAKPKRSRAPKNFSEEERARRRGAATRFDPDEVVRLYVEEGLSSGQIAEQMGMKTKTTAVQILKKRGVWEPAREGKGGRPLSEYCEAGLHLQSKYRVESTPGRGDWHCGPCKRKRTNEWRREQSIKKRDNRLVPHEIEAATYRVIIEGVDRGEAIMKRETAEALQKKLTTLSNRRGVRHDMEASDGE